jgi:flotillin
VDLTLLIAIGGIAVLVLLLVLLVLSRIKVAGPNQAFIVTGRQGREVTSASGVTSRDASGQKAVMGASVFVLRSCSCTRWTSPAAASRSGSAARSPNRA